MRRFLAGLAGGAAENGAGANYAGGE
jgi:hypothetical protein